MYSQAGHCQWRKLFREYLRAAHKKHKIESVALANDFFLNFCAASFLATPLLELNKCKKERFKSGSECF